MRRGTTLSEGLAYTSLCLSLLVTFVTGCSGVAVPLLGGDNTASDIGGERIVRGVQITFYGYDDNDDGTGHLGANAIAYPGFHRVTTEDLGTYDHPSTLATDNRVLKRGARIYIPKIRKYYIMEDQCGPCTRDANAGKTRVDLFMGPNTGPQGAALAKCERAMTLDGSVDVIVTNPGPDWPVSPAPLYGGGQCNKQTFPNP